MRSKTAGCIHLLFRGFPETAVRAHLLCSGWMTGKPEVMSRMDSQRSWPEVSFEEIAIDLRQARFWITSGLPTIRWADHSGSMPELSGMSRLRSGQSTPDAATLDAWVRPFRRTTLQLRLRTQESAAALSPGTVPSTLRTTIRTSKDRKQLASPMRQPPNPYRP